MVACPICSADCASTCPADRLEHDHECNACGHRWTDVRRDVPEALDPLSGQWKPLAPVSK